MHVHPLPLKVRLSLATVTAGDPFVKQVNPILGVIVVFSATQNSDTAPPTPGGQSLTPTRPHLTVIPHLQKGGFVTMFHFGSLT